MSRLKEARALLVAAGIGPRAYRSEVTGCYCSIGALNQAHGGDAEEPLADTDSEDPDFDHRRHEYHSDLRYLYNAATGKEHATMGMRRELEDWNDACFDQARFVDMADADAMAEATKAILAVWDKSIAAMEHDGVGAS